MEIPNSAAVTTLTTLLGQTALGIAEAQSALDRYSEAQIAERDPESSLPVVPFGFSEVELDVSLAMTITRAGGQHLLSVLPASPLGSGFFQATSFNSKLRARIAPMARQPREVEKLDE